MILNHMKEALQLLRAEKPLVLCITNYVSVDFVANSLLALGASPIMSSDPREIEELMKISRAVNINIGTLSKDFISIADKIVEINNDYGKPLVLDPVGAGASLIRTESAEKFAPNSSIIRGNASEIIALSNRVFDVFNAQGAKTSGVDSAHDVSDATAAAKTLASKMKNCVTVSGKQDFITNGVKSEFIKSGEDIMQLITGMGCSVTAVIAAFRAVVHDSMEATKIAMLYFGLCANLAYTKSQKPGSFKACFIDELYSKDFESMGQFYAERI